MAEAVQTEEWSRVDVSLPDEHHIEVDKSLVDRPLHILKQNDLFAVFDNHGDFRGEENGPDGLYYYDTRFLSRLELRLGAKMPLLLDSVVLDDNGALVVDLTNADLHDAQGKHRLPRESLFASRLKFLWGNTAYERILLRRYIDLPQPISLDLLFDADFADLFEVRGEQRPRRGTMEAKVLDERSVRFTYRGLDELERRTTLYLDPPPHSLTARAARWEVDLRECDRAAMFVKIGCTMGDEGAEEPPPPPAAYRQVRRSTRNRMIYMGRLTSSNELFNAVMNRSSADLDMLLTSTDFGLYPYAGVPWYSTVFGRDGIITAMQLLWIVPEIARGVLHALALTQATELNDAADAQPGKILHEMRDGEMARLGEVPFRRYYGTVDATPLFVMLAGMYYHRSGDIETVRSIWPNVLAALRWIDGYGDRDGDGFVEYCRATAQGLANQGWKDSFDSIFHADGRLAEGPIALCEVQGYVFAAKKAGAEMARALGDADLATRLDGEAETLRERFEERFWIEEIGSYALALDGHKEPCRVRSSNAGHTLFTGIASPERAARVARMLLGPKFFTGWGVRTIAVGEARYNPMSYHNGSVWPHDNALIALGLARYGHKAEVTKIFEGLFAAAAYDAYGRLPELFCGFARRRKRGPTAYPVACSPQAWAAAAPFALLAASIGLELHHATNSVRLDNPAFPSFIDDLFLPEVRIGESRMKLRLLRSRGDVTVEIVARSGPARLEIVK